ncbi:MAG: hypothetical protein V3U27_16410 [Candidatus Tectomicrobia bacterium]
MRFAHHALLQRLHQARLVNPRLPTQQHDLPTPRLHLPPALEQQPELLGSANERSRPWRARSLETTGGQALVEHLVHCERVGQSSAGQCAPSLADKKLVDEVISDRADHHRIVHSAIQEAGGNVQCLPIRVGLLPTVHGAQDHKAGVDAQTDRELHVLHPLQVHFQHCHYVETGLHSALRIIVVGLRPAKIPHDLIAARRHDVAGKAAARRGAQGVRSLHDLVEVFRIKRRCMGGRASHPTHEHGELAPLGRGCTWLCSELPTGCGHLMMGSTRQR